MIKRSIFVITIIFVMVGGSIGGMLFTGKGVTNNPITQSVLPSSSPKAYTSHAPIRINGNSGFIAQNGVTGGSGIASNPYRIEGWYINATGSRNYNVIYIGNTTAYFLVQNCKLQNATTGASPFNQPYFDGAGVACYNVQNGIINNCNISNDSVGFYLGGSNTETVSNNTIFNNIYGITIADSGTNIISNNEVYWNNGYGIFGDSSSTSKSKISKNIIFSNGETGIIIQSGGNSISDNNIYSNSCGIWDNAGSNTISNNEIYWNQGDGIFVCGNRGMFLNNKIYSNFNYGIFLEYSSYNVFYNNTLTNDSLDIWSQDLPNYIQTVSQNNTVNGKPIYYCLNQSGLNIDGWSAGQIFLVNCKNSVIKNINITQTAEGIVIAYSKGIGVLKSTLMYNEYGIYLDGTNASTISNNSLSMNTNSGTFVHDSNSNTIVNNTMSFNGYGICMSSLNNNNTISQNNIYSNNNCGFYYVGSSRSTISNNIIYLNNGTGIDVTSSNRTKISHNIICLNNYEGIYLFQSFLNEISNNTITRNREGILSVESSTSTMNSLIYNNIENNSIYGVNISSKQQIIHHNNFLNNNLGGVQGYDNNATKFWNDTFGRGNYWSDYTKRYPSATNNGKVWNIPYQLAGIGSNDYYPLVNPVGNSAPSIIPSAPQSLQSIAGNSEVILSWTPPASDGGLPITTYKIYWGTTSGNYPNNKTVSNVTSDIVTGLTNSVKYYFTVSAINAAGEGQKSTEVSATLGPTSPWPMYDHDLQHTGRSDCNTSMNPGHIKWVFTAGNYITSSPAIGPDGTIYFGCNDHKEGVELLQFL